MMVSARATAFLTAALAASVATCAEDPRSWLERMEHALATRNYQGIFVHEHDGQTETLKIVHRVSAGEVAERIVSLDGSGREVIRQNGELTAYFPDRRVVLVERGPEQGLLLTDLLRLDATSAQIYRVGAEPSTRVSGRAAHVVVVEPLDDLRYGYRVWVDESSAMPLKTQLVTATGHVVEQLVFTELSLPARIPDSALLPAVSARDYRWMRHAEETPVAAGAAAPDALWSAGHWQSGQLPPGFHLTANSMQVLAGAHTVVDHLVFSDGLASVSVFVEPGATAPDAPPGAPAPATVTQVGSSTALSTVVDGHRVTAIGEVPPATVRAIAGSLREGFSPTGGPAELSAFGFRAGAGNSPGRRH